MRYSTASLLIILAASAGALPLVGLEGDGAELPELTVLRVGEEFDEELADRALKAAAASLAAEGYLDARLVPSSSAREGGVLLRVTLERGERAPLGGLTVNGARAVEPRLVEAAARTGWRRDGPTGLIRAVGDLYASAGYLNAEVALVEPRRADDGSLNLTLELAEGDLTCVDTIEVVGLDDDAQRTALAALGLARGDPLTPNALEAARRRMERTGYYDHVALTLDGTTLRLEVEPGRTVYFDGALGLGETGGETELYGEIQFSLVNLGGGGHDLAGLYRRTSPDNADYRAAYTERFLFGSRAALELAYTGLRRANRRSDAGEAELRQPLGDHLELSIAARFSSDFQEGVGSSVYLGAGLGALLDYTDRPRDPTDGFDLWCRLEAGQRRYDARRETPLRARLGGDGFWTPLEPHTLALLLEGGLADVRPPVSLDCFYLGGAYRPRGYRNRELPTDAYALATAEYRLRLGDSGRLFAFGDFAYYRPLSTAPFTTPTTWTRALGYGIGLVVNLGVGSLEVVYALNEDSSLDSGVLEVRLVLDRLL
ncbi:MAG TPA: BamA/TamA family outer membrane protein [bacterium]|nr:BamA/TamA family outer membrane protein [bacterium]